MSAVPCNGIVTVIVTFHPDVVRLGEQIADASAWSDAVVIIDNTPGDCALDRRTVDGAHLLSMGFNAGIAAALNAGVRRASEVGALSVLLLDQDSRIDASAVARLAEVLERYPEVVAVGPRLLDSVSGRVPVYVDTAWGPRLRHMETGQADMLSTSLLPTSGSLVAIERVGQVGWFREDLFIDHVDLEWSLRVRGAGGRLVVSPDASMAHELGDHVRRMRLVGRPMVIHDSPVRDYYNVRNMLLLLRSAPLSFFWRLGLVVTQLRWAVGTLLASPDPWARMAWMARGARDGVRGRGGVA